jgi:hypothetical protein
MAYKDYDDALKKLFDRFLEPEKPKINSEANWREKQESPAVVDWRDAAGPAFVAQCAPRHPQAPYTSPGLLLTVSQWIRRGQREQLWESLIIRCDEETDGTMTVRVIVCNPEWDQKLQIACIRSRPGDKESMTSLACNLDHEELGE